MTIMMAYTKLSSLACNIKDGDTHRTAKKEGNEADLKRREKYYAVEEVPSIFSYLSYMYFVGGSISGPWFEFRDLDDFFEARGHYENIHQFDTFYRGMERFAHAWGLVVVGAVLSKFFNLAYLLKPAFAEHPLWY